MLWRNQNMKKLILFNFLYAASFFLFIISSVFVKNYSPFFKFFLCGVEGLLYVALQKLILGRRIRFIWGLIFIISLSFLSFWLWCFLDVPEFYIDTESLGICSFFCMCFVAFNSVAYIFGYVLSLVIENLRIKRLKIKVQQGGKRVRVLSTKGRRK
jgi:hypothetical protein